MVCADCVFSIAMILMNACEFFLFTLRNSLDLNIGALGTFWTSLLLLAIRFESVPSTRIHKTEWRKERAKKNGANKRRLKTHRVMSFCYSWKRLLFHFRNNIYVRCSLSLSLLCVKMQLKKLKKKESHSFGWCEWWWVCERVFVLLVLKKSKNFTRKSPRKSVRVCVIQIPRISAIEAHTKTTNTTTTKTTTTALAYMGIFNTKERH